ncbi:SLAP domain-containing protein [Lactobacillus helveticus]|nr:SLAP domain-containing protein [Lactobacillus helveticus]
MQYLKKCLSIFGAVLMIISTLYLFSSKASAATYTGTLNHNTYVYDKNGKRKTSHRKLLKGDKVTLVGKLTSKIVTNPYTRGQYDDLPVKAPYYFVIETYGQPVKRCYLSYRMIKKQPYYSMGEGNYVKAANVGRIDKYGVVATETTLTVKRNAHLWNYAGNQISKTVKKGQKVGVDALINLKDYNVSSRVYCFYRIKGTQRYIYANDTKRPRINLQFAETVENRQKTLDRLHGEK